MELYEITQFIKRKWQTITVFVLVFVVLAFVFSIVQPQKYRSEQRFLVVSRYAEDVDPYAATRSTEYLTGLLSEVMYSQRFMNEVLNAGFALDPSMFPEDPKKQKKEWKKTIRTSVVGDAGILDISVYNEDRYITEQLALAVGLVLRTQHGDYHSRGQAVNIQTIDQPITSTRPVQPNIPLNMVAGVVFGLVAGLAYVYLFPKRELKLFKRYDHVLVGVQEPDWSRPMAVPTMKLQNKSMPASLYEDSKMKYPLTTRSGKGTEIGYTVPKHEPPANLPVA